MIITGLTKSVHQKLLDYISQRIDCQRMLPADKIYFSKS